MRKAILVLLLCLLCWLPGMDHPARAQSDSFVIKFGYPAPSDEEFQVSLDSVAAPFVETTRIPRKLKESGFRWGFSVTHLKGELFSGHIVLTLPVPPTAVTGDLSAQTAQGAVRKRTKRRIVKTGSRMFRGIWTSLFWFDHGDPLGQWELTIYLDGGPAQTFAFTVVAPD